MEFKISEDKVKGTTFTEMATTTTTTGFRACKQVSSKRSITTRIPTSASQQEVDSDGKLRDGDETLEPGPLHAIVPRLTSSQRGRSPGTLSLRAEDCHPRSYQNAQ